MDAGQSQGRGSSQDRVGFSRTGPLTALVPSHAGLPWDAFIWRQVTETLLFRERSGREPPKLRPVVLVLDVSPPTFGPVEEILRLAAHTVAQTLRRACQPVVCITVGGQGAVQALEHPAHLLFLFTQRSMEIARPTEAIHSAERIRQALTDTGGVEPVVLLLSHPWWGVEEGDLPTPKGLRGLFVQFPGYDVRPAWANRCERWETLGVKDHSSLSLILGWLTG